MKLDQGDVPGWIEAVSTLTAFGAVAWTLILQLVDRRQEHASNVDFVLWAGNEPPTVFYKPGQLPPTLPEPKIQLGREADTYFQLWLTITNNNGSAINDVRVQLSALAPGGSRVVRLGKVPGGEHHCLYHPVLDEIPRDNDTPPGRLSLLVPLIQFRDQNGKVWQRTAVGELKRIRRPWKMIGGK